MSSTLAGALFLATIVLALALAYRMRPVFVPTTGPNDPVARYRTAVMSRLRLIGIGVPVVIGVITGFVAQMYWDRVQLFIHGGSFGIADPQFGKDLGFYAFDLPFYQVVLGYLFAATFMAFIARQVPGFVFLEAPVGKDPDQRNYIVSNAKIEATGWKPKFSLDAGIEELVKGFAMIRNTRYGNV